MINQVALTGNLAREVELRQTANGVPYVRFVIAVTQKFTNKNGERDADFIACVAWRQTAENIYKYMRKGSRIGITGRVSKRGYDDTKGQRVYKTDIEVEDFYFLEPRSITDGRQQNSGNVGINNQATTPDPFASAGKRVDISDDDLPF